MPPNHRSLPSPRPSFYPSARGPSTWGGTLITPLSNAFLTACTSGPEFVLHHSQHRHRKRETAMEEWWTFFQRNTHLTTSSKYALNTGPACLSIFISPNPSIDLSAREGPREIIKMGLCCSTACLTSRNAEYVARDVPRMRSCEADSRTARLQTVRQTVN